MTAVPDLVALADVAGLLNRVYHLDPPIKPATPFVWWDRSTADRGVRMSLPMPEPDITVGKTNSPLWRTERIVLWYGEWKALKKGATRG